MVFVTIGVMNLAACSDYKKRDDVINQKIVFIQQQVNFSDSYWNRGFYVTKDGEKVNFDVTNENLYGVVILEDGTPAFPLIYGTGNANRMNTDPNAGEIKNIIIELTSMDFYQSK